MKVENLGVHIKQIRGIAYKPSEISDVPLDGYVPVLKGNNISEFGLNTSSLIYIKKTKVRPEQFIRKGDLVITASSGSKKVIGKSIQFDNEYLGSFGAFCKLIRPLKTLYSKYLYHFFKTPYYRGFIENVVQGANINNLKNEHIDDLQILIPEFGEQIRIATLLSRVEALIATRKDNLRLLDEFLKATFWELFGDPAINGRNWKKNSLENLCRSPKDIKCGPFGTQLSKSEFQSDGVAVWGIPQINSQFLIPPNDYVTHEKANELDEYNIIWNDIVMSRKGAVGKCALFPSNLPPGIMHSDVLRIRADWQIINPVYLCWQLRLSRDVERQIANVSSGAIMAGINVGKLKSISVLTPPKTLQIKFATIVEKSESLKRHYQQNLTELEKLYAALSQKAFKGELDLSRLPLPVTEQAAENLDLVGISSDATQAVVENLQEFNQKAASIKDIARAARASGSDAGYLDSVKQAAEELARYTSPLEQIKHMSGIASTLAQLTTALKPFDLPHYDALAESARLAQTMAVSLPQLDLGLLARRHDVLQQINAPFDALRASLDKVHAFNYLDIANAQREQTLANTLDLSAAKAAMSARDALNLTKYALHSPIVDPLRDLTRFTQSAYNSAWDSAAQIRNLIPDYSRLASSALDSYRLYTDSVKPLFYPEDILDILAHADEPLSFYSLLRQLRDEEPDNLGVYEAVRTIVFELLADNLIEQKFDQEQKLMRFSLVAPDAAT